MIVPTRDEIVKLQGYDEELFPLETFVLEFEPADLAAASRFTQLLQLAVNHILDPTGK